MTAPTALPTYEDIRKALKNTMLALDYALNFIPDSEMLRRKCVVTSDAAKDILARAKEPQA